MPNRHDSDPSRDYRYGFNGMEKDNELKGNGNAINYEARFFDPRVGRFLSLDPLSKKFPMLSPFQFASNTPIWAVDLDGLEARVYTDLSAIPHSFISVIDDDGIIHVYTYGQYGQTGNGLGGLYNSGSALVHLVGEDANNYINHEFNSFPIGVYEISEKAVDKQKIIDYYAKEMQTYNIPAEKVGEHAPNYVNEENGSSAVKYKPYWLTPDGTYSENCTSVVTDGLRAGDVQIDGSKGEVSIPAVPWLMNEALWEKSITHPDKVKDVTENEKNAAKNNDNSKKLPVIKLKEIIITPSK